MNITLLISLGIKFPQLEDNSGGPSFYVIEISNDGLRVLYPDLSSSSKKFGDDGRLWKTGKLLQIFGNSPSQWIRITRGEFDVGSLPRLET